MNIYSLLALMPVAVWVSLITSTVIPAISSLVTKAHWDSSITGLITLFLSTANGFFTEWAKDGDGFQWKAALGTALLSYGVALLTRVGLLRGTALESKLVLAGSIKKGEASDVTSLPPEPSESNEDVASILDRALAEAETIHPLEQPAQPTTTPEPPATPPATPPST